MAFDNIPYKSYCWSLGTTSYRTKNFNLNIELQLDLLDKFWKIPNNCNVDWVANNVIQSKYYDFMKENEFVTGEAPLKAKDAREKTSGLVDIGLIYDNRKLTEAGEALLKISQNKDFASNNQLQIPKDSYLYMKQLLKASNEVNGNVVRPFIVLLFLLSKVDYLTLEEYTYLLPLCINKEITDQMPRKIQAVRNSTMSIDEVILNIILGMSNYNVALALLLDNDVTEELICTIGFNRKSRTYDKPYYSFYCALREVCLNKNTDFIYQVYESSRKIKNKPGTLWRNYLFNTSSSRAIAKDPKAHLKSTEILHIKDEREFKTVFFKMMHLFKVKATLSDYLDLNRRYIRTSDIILFEDSEVKLDIVPKQFFNSVIEQLYNEAFNVSNRIFSDCDLVEISTCLLINEQRIVNGINNELGTNISTMGQAKAIVENERYRRLSHLIETRFTDEILLKLLCMFENRDDEGINSLVTDNADIPTIFEYVLGIIWYKVSERHGKILDYMKLSLEADLLPKTHAGGGEADIVYEYSATEAYPEHTLLLEATLADGTNQRRMEMEPVSRHLGQHILRTGNHNSYCIFNTTYLDINVVSDFRGRKYTPYFDTRDYSRSVNCMKIIPLQTSELKSIIENKCTYKSLYSVFDKAYNSGESIANWYEKCIVQEVTPQYEYSQIVEERLVVAENTDI
ncbi:AlwI family type II restriction endonuclease [Clostridium sp. BL-8]|uniref:AlwI family type II restriction endonuclease n=1 Tax=Clostridium sp. BL-8 TaxID=349938 RepID=UPI00098BEF1E|nr:AlwI family type II restriction endonuclease [Clostridium sp. BL-8]OOM78822.1 AlwI restriction endonuclease [Clostridium sp. BL-8]